VSKHAFLSPEWISAARAVRARHQGEQVAVSLKMNLVVEEVPFDTGEIDAHVDTTSGIVDVDLGHLEDADVKVALDYATAKSILVEGDAQAATAAFMAGKVRVEGDMTKLLSFQAQQPTDRQQQIAEELKSITE
jgi:putative sterol carrier protein